MKSEEWRWIQWLKKLLSTQQPEPTTQAEKIVAMQLQIVLPAKVGVIAVVIAYLYHSDWLLGESSQVPSLHLIAIEMLQSKSPPVYIGEPLPTDLWVIENYAWRLAPFTLLRQIGHGIGSGFA